MLNILIIDSLPVQNPSIGRMLRAWGHLVARASTCSEALVSETARCWHLVFISLKNLSSEGLEWISRIRQSWPDALLIVLGDMDRPSLERQVRSHGVDFYLLKTSDLSRLKILVRHFEKQFANDTRSSRTSRVRSVDFWNKHP
jgi:two-component system NtrC family response regulator/two-component system response regulator HydG